jgi:hypothetical protein
MAAPALLRMLTGGRKSYSVDGQGIGAVTGRIIQFGTSRFLQAHVGVFVHEASLSEQNGPVAADRCGSDLPLR